MKTTHIDCKCGIYDTQTTIRDYGHKIIVTEPFIKWINDSGSLDFHKIRLTTPRAMRIARVCAREEKLAVISDDGEMLAMLDDVLD